MAKPTVALDSLLPALLFDLPQVPEVLALDRLRDSARTFCELTHYWQEDVTVTPVDGTTAYTLTLPDGLAVAEVRQALQGGEPVEFGMDGRDIIALEDLPGTGAVTVTAAIKPAHDGTVLYEAIAEEYRDAVASGARAKLLMIIGKPWSQPELAAAHWDMFTSACNKARREVENGFRTSVVERPTVRQVFF